MGWGEATVFLTVVLINTRSLMSVSVGVWGIVSYILFGTVVALGITKFKGLLSFKYSVTIVSSILFFSVIVTYIFFIGLVVNQPIGLAVVAAFIAPAFLITGLVVKNQASILFLILGRVFCSILFVSLIF
jgi:hypothetical protein